MKLLTCHIDNFGKLSNFTINFSDGINVINEPNGWGKSTLAAFLKVMFYGLDPKKEPGAHDKERAVYRPWQGGVYGGYLDFEVGDKQYRIRRTFGKSERFDEFHLFDLATNLESEDYSRDIGIELFDLDSASFKRSIYIMQNDCASCSTDNINAKLGNLVENTNDINNYESANSKLKDMLNYLSPNRATGSIKRRVNHMAELEQELRNFEAAEDAYNQLSQLQGEKMLEKDQLLQERQQFTKDLQRASEQNILLEKRKQYELLWTEERQQGELCKQYQDRFPAGVPKEEDIRKATGTLRQMAETQATIRNLTEGDEETAKYIKLSELFEDEVPQPEKIEDLVAQQKELFAAKEELRHLENQVTVLSSTPEVEPDPQPKAKKKRKRKSGYTIIGIICLIISVVFAVLAPVLALGMESSRGINTAVGFVFVTIVFLVGAFMFFRLGKDSEKETGISDEDSSEETGEMKMIGGDESLDKESLLTLQTRIGEEKQRIRKMEQNITDFLEKFHKNVKPENVVSLLYELSHDVENYDRMKKRKDERIEAEEHLRELQGELDAFAERYHLTLGEDVAAAMSDIQTKAAEYRIALQEYEKSKWKKEQFESQNDMNILSGRIDHAEDLDELTEAMVDLDQQLEAIRADIEQNNRQLDDLQLQLDMRDERAKELKENQQIQEEELHKFEIMTYAQQYLQKAKEQFTARYMEPVSGAFSKYYMQLCNNMVDEWQIDANIHFQTKEQGQMREVWQLSDGYQDLIGICMRLALVDAMYKEEKPFLLLDDPFVNLDEEKVMYGKRMVLDVANEYQTIYFTCHDSRNPLAQDTGSVVSTISDMLA